MKKGCKIAITIVGVALVVVLLRGCVATSYLIPSSGMENSLGTPLKRYISIFQCSHSATFQ